MLVGSLGIVGVVVVAIVVGALRVPGTENWIASAGVNLALDFVMAYFWLVLGTMYHAAAREDDAEWADAASKPEWPGDEWPKADEGARASEE